MAYKAGQAYLFPIADLTTAHLWIVVSEPDIDGNVLVVSATSLNGSKDQTVILNGRDHPFLKWATSIAYGLADLISCEKLDHHFACGNAKPKEDVSPEVLALIRSGFAASPFTKKRVKIYMKQRMGETEASGNRPLKCVDTR